MAHSRGGGRIAGTPAALLLLVLCAAPAAALDFASGTKPIRQMRAVMEFHVKIDGTLVDRTPVK